MNWLFIIVAIVFLIFMIRGWAKGFLRLLFSLVSVLVIIGLMSWLAPKVATGLQEHTPIYQMVQDRCEEKIQEKFETEASSFEECIEEESIALPHKVIGYLVENGETALENAGVYQNIAARMAQMLLSGVSFLIGFLIAIIIVKTIGKMLGIIDHIPILNGMNRLLGLLGGLAEGYIIISLFFAGLVLFSTTKIGLTLTQHIDQSVLLSKLYYNNFFVKLFYGL